MDRNTILFTNQDKTRAKTTKEILDSVYSALEAKGYNPANQIVGYIMSGDPSYITSYGNARNIIRQIERDDIVEVMLKSFLGK